MLFLAALVHGVLILGITFGSGALPGRPEATSSLEVVLVTSDYENRPAPADAVLLAQQNLSGSGNAPADATLTTAVGFAPEADALGPVTDGSPEESRTGDAGSTASPEPVLMARNARDRVADAGDPEQAAAPRETTLPGTANPVDILGRIDERTAVPDAHPRELLVSANTREARIASYLHSWKRKVEQVGTLNFPLVARQSGAGGYPTLEVVIRADGTLRDVIVRNSSGQQRLDQAAVEILRLAAPFEPFPQFLRTDYDVVRFAYEWHFGDGTATVRTAAAGP